MIVFSSRSLTELIDGLQFLIAIVLQIIMLILSVVLFLNGAWLGAFTGLLVLALTFMPGILAHQLRLVLPVEFSLVTNVFLYASFALGEVQDFYAKYWWWDLMLHSLSALIIGLIGFLAIYVFIRARRVVVPPIYVATMTFSIAVTTGSLWEIFEFSMDWFFGFNMQKSGLVDSMTDMIVNALSALVTATMGYFYVKNGDSLLMHRMLTNFLRKNPQLIRKIRRGGEDQ